MGYAGVTGVTQKRAGLQSCRRRGVAVKSTSAAIGRASYPHLPREQIARPASIYEATPAMSMRRLGIHAGIAYITFGVSATSCWLFDSGQMRARFSRFRPPYRHTLRETNLSCHG